MLEINYVKIKKLGKKIVIRLWQKAQKKGTVEPVLVQMWTVSNPKSDVQWLGEKK